MITTLALFLTIGVSSTPLTTNCPDPSLRDYDVIVVGAGSSGTMAAIQAARRLNTTVALIESMNVIGGQIVASGVSTMDGGLAPPVRSGLYLEYLERIEAHYAAIGLSPHTCYGGGSLQICSEPHVAEQVLQDMLEAPIAAGSTLCLFKNTTVTQVRQDPVQAYRVIGVRTGTNPTVNWSSHVVIDATEYGDLLPLTIGDYRVGNWRRFSGQAPSPNACVQDITYTGVIRDYTPGPAPQIPEPGGYGGMADVFMTWVTDNPPWLYPGHPYPNTCPWNWLQHNAYRGLPDSAHPGPSNRGPLTRSQANYEVIDFPGYWLESYGPYPPVCPDITAPVILHSRGDLPISFIESPTVRHTKICEAKNFTLQFLHYMQRTNPPEQPEWSIADDEYASPNVCYAWYDNLALSEQRLPPMPYVRESRRIVSVDPLTGSEIKRTAAGTASRAHTSLAVGDYASQDMHGCNAPENLETGPLYDALDTPSDFTVFFGPFQIPFETFIPVGLDGFLPAEKNLGYSRIAATAARMQPSTMLVGQAAGALAALAANGYQTPRQPRAVRVLDIQRALLEDADPVALAVETFSDVPLGHAAWRDAQLVSIHEVMPAISGGPYLFQFQPTEWALRADMVEVLDNLFTPTPPLPGSGTNVMREELAHALAIGMWGSLPPDPGTPPIFVDVPPSNPLRGAIEELYQGGFMKACTSSGTNLWFCPSGIPGKTRRDVLAHAAAEVMLQTWP